MSYYNTLLRIKNIVGTNVGSQETTLGDLRILTRCLEHSLKTNLPYNEKVADIFDYLLDKIMELMTWSDVPQEVQFDFVLKMVKKTCRKGSIELFKNALPRLWNLREMSPTTQCITELLFIALRNNHNDIAFHLYYFYKDFLKPEGIIPEFLLPPIFFWEKMQRKAWITAQKKIYFWWIPLCYDLSRPSGQRMAEHFKTNMENLLRV